MAWEHVKFGFGKQNSFINRVIINCTHKCLRIFGFEGWFIWVPKSLEINPCNLSCWEHGSWDLPFHTGSHNLKSQLWHGCLHGNTFWRWGLGHVLRVGLSKKLDLTFHKSFINIFAWNNQDLPLMIINHVLMVFLGSNVGTFPPRWDLLTWVGLGTPCEPTSSYHKPPPLLINHKGLVTPPN